MGIHQTELELGRDAATLERRVLEMSNSDNLCG